MLDEKRLRSAFVAIEVNAGFSEATLTLMDDSRLVFRHCVGERTAKAIGTSQPANQASLILERIDRFRLNGKHLDVVFNDGSRWELIFDQRPTGTEPSR